MNNGKKAISGKQATKKSVSVPNDGLGKRIGAGIIGILLVVVIIVVAWEGLAPKYLINFDGDKLKQDDLIYDIYQTEMIGAQMASIYQQFGYTTDYWNMDNGDGTTTQTSLANEAAQGYIYNRILYAKAVEEGYEATDEEKKSAEDTAKEAIEALTEDKGNKLGLTTEVLTQRTLEESVVDRYKQDMIDSFDIDDEGIKAGVDYETYHGYNVEYFYVPTTTTNDDGETVDVENKDALHADLEAALTKGQTSGDWSKVIDAEDENATVKYATKVLTPDSETFSEELTAKIFAMANNAETGIVEEENGYYAIRMIDNDDHSEYDKAVEQAISDAEEDAFTEYYNGLYEEHDIKVYDKNWSSIVFGSITV